MMPATSTTTIQPNAHTRIAVGGGDVTANGFTPPPFDVALTLTVANTAGCSA